MKVLKIKTNTGELTVGDVDKEGEIPVTLNKELMWIRPSDLIEFSKHLMYLGKKIAG